ncbi:MAG: DUF3445 domain-containing protein [Alphaproteobacteria bacterium]|nr:hypothetical protein [Hyphomonas sp.]MBR9806188.1 DUF3445 domain-containing protein [Alphaproteobacteria bacterium]|tara:strand:+ start:1502 stop:2335 length:834 start_codon:yes stop_codon:yes gene_type:complete
MRAPPYLPFLSGPPGLAPGLKPIAWQGWLTPDSEAEAWLGPKRDLMRDRRAEVFAAHGAEAEMAEAAVLVLSALGQGICEGEWPTPLEAAAAEVFDDLCLMVRGEDGLWRLQAASLCAPTFWRLSDKMGEPLGGLHAPVPGADPDLVRRISRIFDGLQPGLILERFNWTVQAGEARFTPSSSPLKALAAETPEDAALDMLYLRVERQTITKLPETGAVLFTIRIVMDPLRAALAGEEAAEAFRAAWQGITPEMADYKGWAAYDGLVRAALRQLGRRA